MSERSSSSSKRRHSKVNIVKQEGITDFLKSLESEIELNRGYLSKSKSSSSKSLNYNSNINDENKVTQSMINPPTMKSINKNIKLNTSLSKSPKKSSLTKSLNFDYNADLSNNSDNNNNSNNENDNNRLSTIKPKKRVSVISPKRTPLSNLSLNNSNISNTHNSSINTSSTLFNSTSSIINSSRLSIKDLKDSSSSSSSDHESSTSGKRPSSRRELAKQMEETHLALEEMINLQTEMKLHIPKDLKKQVSQKSEEFKSDCTKVLSKIDVLLSRVVKNLNESKDIQKSPKKSILYKSINGSNNTTQNNTSKLITTPLKSKLTSTPLRNSQSSPNYSKYSPNINR